MNECKVFQGERLFVLGVICLMIVGVAVHLFLEEWQEAGMTSIGCEDFGVTCFSQKNYLRTLSCWCRYHDDFTKTCFEERLL